MAELTITIPAPPRADVVAAYCCGDADMAAGETLRERAQALVRAAAESAVTQVVLDVSGVIFVDTGGIRALARARDTAQEHGLTLVLRDPSAPVQRLLQLTQMTSTFGGARDVGSDPGERRGLTPSASLSAPP